MPVTFDLKSDVRYLQGKEIGLKIGIELGIAQGLELGRQALKHAILLLLHRDKLSVTEIAEFTGISVDYILEVRKEAENN
jgi:predicted transposase YdaD